MCSKIIIDVRNFRISILFVAKATNKHKTSPWNNAIKEIQPNCTYVMNVLI